MPTLQNPRYKILTARTILDNLKKQMNKPGLMAILLWISSALPLFSSYSGNQRRQREKVHVCACVSVCVCVYERKGCLGARRGPLGEQGGACLPVASAFLRELQRAMVMPVLNK